MTETKSALILRSGSMIRQEMESRREGSATGAALSADPSRRSA